MKNSAFIRIYCHLLKKIGLVVFCLVFLFPGCNRDKSTFTFPDNETPSWDFPIKPGSEKWKSLYNQAQKLEACQIPEHIKSTLQTEELIKICLNYPLLMDVFAFNFFCDGFKAYEANFNGFRELLNRTDSSTELFTYYKKIDSADVGIYLSLSNVLKISIVELMLSHQQIVSKFTSLQKKEIVGIMFAKLNTKKLLTQDFMFCLHTNYLSIIKIIQCDTESNLVTEANKLVVYFTGSFLPDNTIISQADQLVNTYLARR